MNDEELLAKVKKGLESASGVSFECVASVREEASRIAMHRRRRMWWRKGVGLLAASLAIALAGQFLLREETSAEGGLISTIELLSVVDGRQVEGEGAAELLLAWQDAPYVALCAASPINQ